MGNLARLPLGPFLIDFLGHMRADARLRQSFLDTDFPTAVGLGPWLDSTQIATRAFARFGVGFIEIGPVTLEGSVASRPVKRLEDQEALWMDNEPDSISLADCNQRLSEASDLAVPVIVRLAPQQPIDETSRRLIRELHPSVRLISLPTLATALELGWSTERWSSYLREMRSDARSLSPPRSVLLGMAADQDIESAAFLIDTALREGVGGVVVDGSMQAQPDGRLVGLPAREFALQLVNSLRRRWATNIFIIASGGVHEPEHALKLCSAGADLVQVDTGLVYTGPGLPKRINDCLLFETIHNNPHIDPPARVSELTWFWTMLMGGGMLLGGLLALAIAATKVVLPYDEAFLGMSRESVTTINPRLLDFMAHDRISLAGVMVPSGCSISDSRCLA